MASERTIVVRDLGLTEYGEVHRLQQELQAERIRGEGVDTLLLTEHRPVFTLGRNHPEPNLRATEAMVRAAGIEVAQTERGGDITYHGPGQLVAYGIIDLQGWGVRVVDYVSALEDTMFGVLGEWGIEGDRHDVRARGLGGGAEGWVGGAARAALRLDARGGAERGPKTWRTSR